VRREWLTTFLARKTPPKGAEALICEAVITGQHSLYKAMESAHPMLRKLLDVGADRTRWDSRAEVASIAAKATTPKAATMIALATVLTAWEDSIDQHTWRNPTTWDARVLGALIEWGDQASDVESILLGHPETSAEDDTTASSDGDAGADNCGEATGDADGDAA
jgi:ParB family chromosome partitioning protein